MFEDDMKLPERKTCASCFHLAKCVELWDGDESYEYCSFSPSRFVERDLVNGNHSLVELIGRQQIAGFVSDAMIEGRPFIKVEVPETKVHRAYTCYFSVESVYAISPIGEAHAINITATREQGRFHENPDALVAEESSVVTKGHGQVISKGRRAR